MKIQKPYQVVIGWKEWCGLPELDLPLIKAKVDTGAKTSSLHAYDIEGFRRKGHAYVRFVVHPLQANARIVCPCEAIVVDRRHVMSSNGHKEMRYVIETELRLAGQAWPIQLTLSNRDPLRFRMLLGRAALVERVLIDPVKDYCLGRYSIQDVKQAYRL